MSLKCSLFALFCRYTVTILLAKIGLRVKSGTDGVSDRNEISRSIAHVHLAYRDHVSQINLRVVAYYSSPSCR